jgi:hypothetical protein
MMQNFDKSSPAKPETQGVMHVMQKCNKFQLLALYALNAVLYPDAKI